MDFEKANYDYLTRNYISIDSLIDYLRAYKSNTIPEIVTFIFQATSSNLNLYKIDNDELFEDEPVKLSKINNPSLVAIDCVNLAKNIPIDTNAYNWFTKQKAFNAISCKYYFLIKDLENTSIADLIDLDLTRTPMRERDSYSKASYIPIKTLKNGVLVDELIFSKSVINNNFLSTSHIQENKVISDQKEIINKLYDELSEAQTIHHEDGGLTIPFYFNDEEIKDLKFFAEKENLSEDEFIKKAINSELDEMHPILEFFNYYTQNNIKDKNITDLFNLINKTGESNKFYKALSKAGFVPKINQDEKGNFKDDLLKSLNQQLTAKDEQIAELKKQLNERLEAGTPAQSEPTISERTENGYLTTIGLLLDMMTAPKGIENRPPFQSQSKIIEDISERDIQGQKKATLENRFSLANKAYEQAKKK